MVNGCFELIGYLAWGNTKNTHVKNQTGRQRTQAKVATVTKDIVPQLITKEDYENLMRMLKSAKVNEENRIANMSGKSNPKAYMTDKTKIQKYWIIDSGASEHVTPNTKLLKKCQN